MTDKTTIIYNGACPVCDREIGHYKDRAAATDAQLAFVDLSEEDTAALGLSPEDAAKRMTAISADGRVLRGVDAFVAIWRELPGFGWLARLIALPGLRHIAGAAYDYVIAPIIYGIWGKKALARASAARPSDKCPSDGQDQRS